MKRLDHEANLDHVAAQLLVKAQTKPQLEAEEFQVVAAELAEQASRLRAEVIWLPLSHKSYPFRRLTSTARQRQGVEQKNGGCLP